MEDEVGKRREQLRRFMSLWKSNETAHGQYDIDHDLSTRTDKVTGKARTIREPLTAAMFANHLAGRVGLGLIPILPSNKAQWGLIDIDEYGNSLDVKVLTQRVKDIREKTGIPLVIYRSKSGGAHVVVHFVENKPLRCDLLRKCLREIAGALGYPSVEIFPKQDTLGSGETGNWVNGCYFFIAGPTDRYAYDEEGEPILVFDDYLDFAESRCIEPRALLDATFPQRHTPFFDGPVCLDRMASDTGPGFPEGSRNITMFNVGIYLKSKFPDQWQDHMVQINQDLFDPPLPNSELQNLIKQHERKSYGYQCDQEPLRSFCKRETCLSRKYGVGGGDMGGGGSEIEAMIQGVSKTVVTDYHGNIIQDDNVVWYVNVNGMILKLPSVDFFSQDRFLRRVGENCGCYPQPMRPQRWRAFLDNACSTATDLEIPYEETREGQIIMALLDYCTDHTLTDNRSEIETGKVYQKEDGSLWFKHKWFYQYLIDNGYLRPGIDTKFVGTTLRAFGAKRRSIRIGTVEEDGKDKDVIRDAWCVPELPKDVRKIVPDSDMSPEGLEF